MSGIEIDGYSPPSPWNESSKEKFNCMLENRSDDSCTPDFVNWEVGILNIPTSKLIALTKLPNGLKFIFKNF